VNSKVTQTTRENEGCTTAVLINKYKFYKTTTTLTFVAKPYNFQHWLPKTTSILTSVVKTYNSAAATVYAQADRWVQCDKAVI
jgi:hypothetical protein